MKRILITNDDGIRSSGIIRLVEAARALGEVTVIAPDREHSAKAHSISILEPVDFMPYAFPVPGVTAWVCSGRLCARRPGISPSAETGSGSFRYQLRF